MERRPEKSRGGYEGGTSGVVGGTYTSSAQVKCSDMGVLWGSESF